MSSTRFEPITKFLHLVIAAAVTLQLINSQIMKPPKPGRIRDIFEITGYELHEWIGMIAVVATLIHFFRSATTVDDARFSVLFPWRRGNRARILEELQNLASGRLPSVDTSGGLASFIHGLGLLSVTAMAATGTILFYGWPEDDLVPKSVKLVAEGHEFLANFVWLYWIGHIALAVWHHLQGHDTLTSMMRFWRR